MPHIQMRVDRAIQIANDEPEMFVGMFNMQTEQGLIQLTAMQAAGDVYLPTEGCPTFDNKKGCQCSDNDATYRIIKEREKF